MADVTVDLENKNPKELLGQGIKAYVLQDYSSAVAALSKASEILVTEHKDDLHDSLGEVYLYYGKSLLGLAREENEALGDAVPKGGDDDSEEEEEAESSEENNAENEAAAENEDKKENNKTEETKNEDSKTEKTVKEDNKTEETRKEDDKMEETKKEDDKMEETKKEDDKKEETKKEDSKTEETKKEESKTQETKTENGDAEVNGSEKTDGDENNTEAKDTEDEEPTDLQVAWEVLELAKRIYQRHGEGSKKHLAETLTVLGEVSLESENFESAINDIKEALTIQKSLFAKDSRTVAETCYKLGVAYSTNSQFDEAVESFKDALEYLSNRINTLEKVEENKAEAEDEIKELKNLIPDIEEKISDMKTYKEETIKQITSAMNEPKVSSSSSTNGASSSKVNDISHLVKRKRNIDDADEKEVETPSKKPAV